ncbi:hypothetical protein [Hathewaya massiliensis]|uniref:hypothetical protein n=1 Tax=Hathewaya massiliensis TaxID=1964382 RepID=UPI00115711FF|nr:hypothetical protein [Hathewaya massiliensis]
MILQEYIEELGSGILNIKDDKIYLTGFMSPERLYSYYLQGENCIFSQGIYDYEELNFAYIQDNSLFIILKDNVEQSKIQFELIKKSTVKYKNEENKTFSKVYSIRKCKYTDVYNYRDGDKSILFDTLDELKKYFFGKFNTELIF